MLLYSHPLKLPASQHRAWMPWMLVPLLPGWMAPERGAGMGPSPAVGGQQPGTLRAGQTQANRRRSSTELGDSDRVAGGREALLPQCFWGQEMGFQLRCCPGCGAAELRVWVLLALGDSPPAWQHRS